MTNIEGLTPNFKQNVLISINALIDIDVGLFNLIKEDYLDPSVFNIEYFKSSTVKDFIQTTYFRTNDNPLYDISVIDNTELLDDYYAQFCTDMFDDIYDKSTYTDIVNLISLFLDTNEIDVTIMYYRDHSYKMLLEDIEGGRLPKKIKLIDGKKLKGHDLDKYSQIYLRSIYEFSNLPLKSFTSPKNFYISSFGPNFNEKGALKITPAIHDLMFGKLMHDISIFDIYSKDNIRKKKS